VADLDDAVSRIDAEYDATPVALPIAASTTAKNSGSREPCAIDPGAVFVPRREGPLNRYVHMPPSRSSE